MPPRPYKDVFTLQMFATGLINPMGSTDREYDRLAETLLGRPPKDQPLPETKFDRTTGNVVTSRWITGDLETGDDSSLRMFADIPLNEWNEMSEADRIPFLKRAVERRSPGSLSGDPPKLLEELNAIHIINNGSDNSVPPMPDCPPAWKDHLNDFVTREQVARMLRMGRGSLKTNHTQNWPTPDIARNPRGGRQSDEWKLGRLLVPLKQTFPEKFEGEVTLQPPPKREPRTKKKDE